MADSHGPRAWNSSRLRRPALDLPRRDTTAKGGSQTRRLRAEWDNDYLRQLISQWR